MSKNKTQHNPGKISPLIKITVGLIKRNPKLLDDHEYLMATLRNNIPQLCDKEKCANCGASMIEYLFEFDVLDALLLLEMGKAVKENVSKWGTHYHFTKANQIRVQHLTNCSYAMKSRTTQCSKLGLIAKLRGANGKQVPGMWVITRRGFEALSGVPVPRTVRVWRGKIEERTEEKITLGAALAQHRDKVVGIIKKGKTPRSDYRELVDTYNANEWVHIAGTHDGALL